jgi:hypothetical protein
MILHTIINEADIFAQANQLPKTEFLNISGGMLEYKINNGRRQAVRLYSTNPYLYLDSLYAPDSEINSLKGNNNT